MIKNFEADFKNILLILFFVIFEYYVNFIYTLLERVLCGGGEGSGTVLAQTLLHLYFMQVSNLNLFNSKYFYL